MDTNQGDFPFLPCHSLVPQPPTLKGRSLQSYHPASLYTPSPLLPLETEGSTIGEQAVLDDLYASMCGTQ